MLKLVAFTGYLVFSFLLLIHFLSCEELDPKLKRTTTSQKDLLIIKGASISVSKLNAESLRASMDINSTQCSLRT